MQNSKVQGKLPVAETVESHNTQQKTEYQPQKQPLDA